MTRPDGWPVLLDQYLEQQRDKLFVWGLHDCVTFTLGWRNELYGGDLHGHFRGAYDTHTGAMRVMAANRVTSIEGAGEYLYGHGRPPQFAQRGDVVMARGALGISAGAFGAFLAERGGLVYVPQSDFTKSWNI